MGSMKCPHCGTTVYIDEEESSQFYELNDEDKSRYPDSNGYDIAHDFCPACGKLIVMLRTGFFSGGELEVAGDIDILYPKFSSRPLEPEVPEIYRQDFVEAAGVLSISPKASAAISRRLLQQILRDDVGVRQSDLSKEIGEFITRKDVPSPLSGAVDAVRHVGNFAAHPLKETNTGAIVDVEPEEADWLLDVLESLFDFVFVQPRRLEEKQKQLNAKLAKHGKPKMKGT